MRTNDNASLTIDWHEISEKLSRQVLYKEQGKILASRGIVFEGCLPGAAIGSIVSITRKNLDTVKAEIVGIKGDLVYLMPLGDSRGISTSSWITLENPESTIQVGEELLGKVLDGNGLPMDGSTLPSGLVERSIYAEPPSAINRPLIREKMELGVRAVDGLLTCGKGQRIGIMSGSGVGKSTLLGMMARNSSANVNVLALVGERGRELLEFVEKDLGPEGLSRSVVVCATSDKSPLLRMRSAYVATTIAEYFRDQGLDVVLMMDSVTRFAMAQREISLSIGEPPSSKGYTPSVFSTLPKLLERAGNSPDGSITGIYSVLVEGDDMDDPIADTVRATIDGHIVLSRKLAEKNHYPAIDVSASVSRVMNDVIDGDHSRFASEIKELITVYRDAEDLISVGAYIKGSNPKIDKAIDVHDMIEKFLRQKVDESVDIETLKGMMERILIRSEDTE